MKPEYCTHHRCKIAAAADLARICVTLVDSNSEKFTELLEKAVEIGADPLTRVKCREAPPIDKEPLYGGTAA